MKPHFLKSRQVEQLFKLNVSFLIFSFQRRQKAMEVLLQNVWRVSFQEIFFPKRKNENVVSK